MTLPRPAPAALVLIRARALTGFAALIASLEVPLLPLLGAAGIAPQMLDTPEAPVALSKVVALIADSASRLGVPDFGLRLSRHQDIGVLGPVELLALHSATVGEALAAIAANMPYHCPGLQVALGPDAERAGFSQIRIAVADDGSRPLRHMVELYFGVIEQFLRSVTGDGGAGWRIAFRHDSPLAPVHYGAYFAATVSLRQSCDKLSFPSRLLGVPIAPSGSALQVAAQRYVSNLRRRFPLDITHQVETLVERQLAAGGGSLKQVARQLGLHERTLQRRLKEQDSYFEDIVDRVRRRHAEQYLPHNAIPLVQVAALLGYTEQSSFVRACRRWFGRAPQACRARHN
jgi:AraC-like DNA-binding protein